GEVPARGAADRQRRLASRPAHRRGAAGQPASGVPAAAELQPAAEPDRAVLEEAAAAGDAQPPVRHAGGPEGVAAGQPLLLPDHAAEGEKHHPRTTQAEEYQMRQPQWVHVSGAREDSTKKEGTSHANRPEKAAEEAGAPRRQAQGQAAAPGPGEARRS